MDHTGAVESAAIENIKIPLSLHEVDNGRLLGFGIGLAQDHPVSCRTATHQDAKKMGLSYCTQTDPLRLTCQEGGGDVLDTKLV